MSTYYKAETVTRTATMKELEGPAAELAPTQVEEKSLISWSRRVESNHRPAVYELSLALPQTT